MKKINILLIIFLVSIVSLFSSENKIGYEELSHLIEKGSDYTLLDVRTAGEFQSGHIPTAELIPYDVLPRTLDVQSKDELIIVYCRSGRRSGIARKVLEDTGYTNIRDFGGISRWKGELE